MMRTMTWSILLGAGAAAGAAAWFASTLDGELSRTVAVNRWILWLGTPACALAVVLALATLVGLLRWLCGARDKRAVDVPDYLARGAAVLLMLAAAGVASWFVPVLMAEPLAQTLAGDEHTKAVLRKNLGQRTFAFADAKAELERIVEVGENWRERFFGGPAGAAQSTQPIVLQLGKPGMIRYAGQVEEKLQYLDWPVPAAADRLAYRVDTDAEKEALLTLKEKIQGIAHDLKERHERTRPKPVAFVGRWVENYARQAEQILVVKAEPPEELPNAIKELLDKARQLKAGLEPIRQLNKKQQEASDAWKKAAEGLRGMTQPAWAKVPACVSAALAVTKVKQVGVVDFALGQLANTVRDYANVAKQAKWWDTTPGLKEAYQKLREDLAAAANIWSAKVSSTLEYAPVAKALEQLQAALDKALATDKVDPSSDKSATGTGTNAQRATWNVDDVLQFVASRWQLDNWADIELELGGKKIKLVQAIKKHWNDDFRVPPPVVSPEKRSEDEAIRHAVRIGMIYIKHYAAQLAKEWEKKVAQVNEAKKGLNEALGQVYPESVRKPIRALFTEPWNYWSGRRDELKKDLSKVPFDAHHVDVELGHGAGRANVAVEENRRMAEAFVAALKALAASDQDIEDTHLNAGRIWYTVFHAGNGEGKQTNPFDWAIQARRGLSVDKPRDADGTVIKTPDGQIDWSKAKGPYTGGIKELGGATFQARLKAPEPLPPPPVNKDVAVGSTPPKPVRKDGKEE